MKKSKIFLGTVILAVGLVQVGCSTGFQASQNQNQPSQSSNNNMNMDHSKMNMPNADKSGNQAKSNDTLQKVFTAELNGFTKIEQDAKAGNVNKDQALADQLHEVFHAAILAPLKDKKGNTYAENIYAKYDELQDAVKNQDKEKILSLVKINRDNLYATAKTLGVSIK
ncbi:hypothetical protein PP175_03655 [Aneurinibacillus sp. Ricciae_BoGa-3]|uniref:hypothetical protein n=1 Tax=Aneurinibacillus sp. Ricciae_BoGa-3 TaxID=3022697 RepID=UPI00234252AD|nr:hypothetical protein [Aneurinibacillus sp. Ricciae_BoGa-3]WCK55095.1 hypothetical protein PP175_03655 [Aneurinibacillus sp. Ricciae_BoGa-3]